MQLYTCSHTNIDNLRVKVIVDECEDLVIDVDEYEYVVCIRMVASVILYSLFSVFA